MKFTIDVAVMQRILGTLSTVASLNAPDNTGRIFVKAEGESVLFVVNNNETAIKVNETDGITVEESGEMLLSYSELRTFIPKFIPFKDGYGSKDFVFKPMKTGYYIYVDTILSNGKSSKGKIKLKEYNSFGYIIPSNVDGISFILNSDVIKPAAAKALYAIDQNETRAELRAVNVTFDDEFIYFAGTNGKILSEYKTFNVSDCKEGKFLFKLDFISNLTKILPSNTQVFFNIGDGKMTASFDSTILFGRQVIGKPFPDYHALFNNYKDTITLSRDILSESLKPLVESLDPDDNKRLTLTIKDRSIFLSSESADFMCEDNITYDGSFIIDVNGMYMLKTIEAIKDDILIIKFTDENSTLIFDSGNFENQKALITSIKRRTNV